MCPINCRSNDKVNLQKAILTWFDHHFSQINVHFTIEVFFTSPNVLALSGRIITNNRFFVQRVHVF